MRSVFSSIVSVGILVLPASLWAQVNACDLAAPFGTIDAADVQAAINMFLGAQVCPSTLNIAGAGICNAVVVQRIINAVLGGPCVTPTTHGVTLTWTASTSANVAGYNVYRSTTKGGPYSQLNSSPVTVLTYADNNVVAGQTYYYVFTAVDSSKNESAYSTEVSGTIPTP